MSNTLLSSFSSILLSSISNLLTSDKAARKVFSKAMSGQLIFCTGNLREFDITSFFQGISTIDPVASSIAAKTFVGWKKFHKCISCSTALLNRNFLQFDQNPTLVSPIGIRRQLRTAPGYCNKYSDCQERLFHSKKVFALKKIAKTRLEKAQMKDNVSLGSRVLGIENKM